MKTLRLVALSLSAALAAGCSSAPTAQSSADQGIDTASITGRWVREGMALTWEGHRLDTIDGNKVSFGLAFNPYVVTVKVEPGPRKLVVLALFNVDRTQYSATIPMEVTIKPSTAYAINAAISGNYIESWLELSGTGEVVTEKFRGECKKSVAVGIGFMVGPCTPSTP